jgi:hypothetical protein
MRKVRYFLALLAFCFVSTVLVADEVKVESGAVETITERELRAHINFLASEELEGRETGTNSLKVASKYIEAEFTKSSLSPAPGQKDYFQDIKLSLRKLAGTPELSLTSSVTAEECKKSFEHNKDFTVLDFSGSGETSAQVVFVGYGVTAPEDDYDDYAGLDVKGKAVLVLRYAPGYGEKGSPFEEMSHHAFLQSKYENAVKHGASAFLLVTGARYSNDRSPSGGSGSMDGSGSEPGIPALHVSPAVADEILGEGELDKIENKIAKDLKPSSFEVKDVKVSISVKMEASDVGARNVIGCIQGSDPQLSHEFIIIGAHYDHLGKRGGKIFAGADDNASGTSAILEVAEAFALSEKKPVRSIMFIAFAGEEKGLLGSRHYVENPLVPLSDTVLMINLDMVGRAKGNNASIGGGRLNAVIEKICEESAKQAGLEVRMSQTPGGGSDHASFFACKIPALFIISSSSSEYHTPRDTPDKINIPVMTRVAKLTYLIANSVANLPERPKVDFAELSKKFERPRGRRPYLGVSLNETEKGVEIEKVAENSPAQEAGLKPQDIILKVKGKEVKSLGEVHEILRATKIGEEIEVEVLRSGEKKIIKLKVGSPGRR